MAISGLCGLVIRDLELEPLSVLSVHLVPSWILVRCKERSSCAFTKPTFFIWSGEWGWETLFFVEKSSYLRLLPFWASAKPDRVEQTLVPFLPLYLFFCFLATLQKEKRQLEQNVFPRAVTWREKIIIILSSIVNSLREVGETLARGWRSQERLVQCSLFRVRQQKQAPVTGCRLKPHSALGQMHPCQK